MPIEVFVPDIGGFKDVSVIDVLVTPGQDIDKETPLITIETEKAAMDVPAPFAGRIAAVSLKRGDKVSQGSLILVLDSAANGGAGAAPVASPPAADPAPTPPAAAPQAPPGAAPQTPPLGASVSAAAPGTAAAGVTAAAPVLGAAPPAPAGSAAMLDETVFSKAHASPSVRKFARELGANLGAVAGTGPKGRITLEDVKAHVKRILTSPPPPAAAAAIPKVPEVDFAKFGPVDVRPLMRIQKISGARLQASWMNLPHVTQHDDADITALEALRTQLKAEAAVQGVRLTPLAFIVRACARALKDFPSFNSSLDPGGENLVFKQYVNIGFAADTPNGLVVPVIRDADHGSVYDIARALAALSEKARAGKLTAAEMQGGTFTVSSLGGIGGTSFTPIINAPEVAILGVSRSSLKPVFDNGGFVPRLMLPLSLSYDHRVIDGAAAARFVVRLAKLLGDPRTLL